MLAHSKYTELDPFVESLFYLISFGSLLYNVSCSSL